MPMTLEPFDYKKHKPQDLGKGGLSTEVIITVDDPNTGEVMNIPSVFWDSEGVPTFFDTRSGNPQTDKDNQNKAIKLALEYEKATGKKFPRFSPKAYQEAGEVAHLRSIAGGASKGSLAVDVVDPREEQAKTAKTFKEAL